jgi:hypothetical protein
MKSKNIVWILLAGVIIIAGIAMVYSVYHKPHRQASNEAPALEVQATELYNAYVSDEVRADSLYLDKVLQVNGVVEKILANAQGEKVLMLETPELFGISCSMDSSQQDKLQHIEAGTTVAIKGICHGMLMDVILVKCVLTDITTTTEYR